MSSDSERLLVQQIRQGDPRAWETSSPATRAACSPSSSAACTTAPPARTWCRKRLSASSTACPTSTTRRELQTYLFTIASHKLTDHLRKAGRHPLSSVSEGAGDMLHHQARRARRRSSRRPQRRAARARKRRHRARAWARSSTTGGEGRLRAAEGAGAAVRQGHGPTATWPPSCRSASSRWPTSASPR